MNPMLLDLMGYRCPSMQSKLRRGLSIFGSQETKYLLVKSVEPRLVQNIKEYLAHDDNMSGMGILQHESTALTASDVKAWSGAGYYFDEDDLNGITKIHFVLVRKSDVYSGEGL